jgi:hypothetical protein
MSTVSIVERSFAPTVPLLGAQGWIVAPADVERGAGVAAILRQWLRRSRTRHDVAELDAVVESRKHFWQR